MDAATKNSFEFGGDVLGIFRGDMISSQKKFNVLSSIVTSWWELKYGSLLRSSWLQQRKDSLGSHGFKKKGPFVYLQESSVSLEQCPINRATGSQI